jgi:cysteinyl-tRNA synthetase
MVSTITPLSKLSSLKRESRMPWFNFSLLRLTSDTYSFSQAQTTFRASLCDSFNTPEALIYLRDLVSRTNVYINSQGKNLNIGLVETIAQWVGKMLKMFGLSEGEKSEIGWGQEGTGDDNVNVSYLPLIPWRTSLTYAPSGKRS